MVEVAVDAAEDGGNIVCFLDAAKVSSSGDR